jgi:hypothetical protein
MAISPTRSPTPTGVRREAIAGAIERAHGNEGDCPSNCPIKERGDTGTLTELIAIINVVTKSTPKNRSLPAINPKYWETDMGDPINQSGTFWFVTLYIKYEASYTYTCTGGCHSDN